MTTSLQFLMWTKLLFIMLIIFLSFFFSMYYRTDFLAGALLSPSPTPPVFSRWSTSLLNSAGSSPASSARSSFNHRQPYLGWRSQERLTNPRTPAERLAQGILPQLQAANKVIKKP